MTTTTETPATATTGFGALLTALLLREGCAVSFTYEPADGYMATVDVFPGDDTLTTHRATSRTPLAALEKAAADAGIAADVDLGDDDETESLAQAQAHRRILIHVLDDVLWSQKINSELVSRRCAHGRHGGCQAPRRCGCGCHDA